MGVIRFFHVILLFKIKRRFFKAFEYIVIRLTLYKRGFVSEVKMTGFKSK